MSVPVPASWPYNPLENRAGLTMVSDCCAAPVSVAGRTTQYHVCMSCEKACDAVPVEPATYWDAPNQQWLPLDHAKGEQP